MDYQFSFEIGQRKQTEWKNYFTWAIHPDFSVTAGQMTAQNEDCSSCLPSQVSTANGKCMKLIWTTSWLFFFFERKTPALLSVLCWPGCGPGGWSVEDDRATREHLGHWCSGASILYHSGLVYFFIFFVFNPHLRACLLILEREEGEERGRERGREREREKKKNDINVREKRWLVASHTCPNQG